MNYTPMGDSIYGSVVEMANKTPISVSRLVNIEVWCVVAQLTLHHSSLIQFFETEQGAREYVQAAEQSEADANLQKNFTYRVEGTSFAEALNMLLGKIPKGII